MTLWKFGDTGMTCWKFGNEPGICRHGQYRDQSCDKCVIERLQAENDGLRSFRDRDVPLWKSKFAEARREIRRLQAELDAANIRFHAMNSPTGREIELQWQVQTLQAIVEAARRMSPGVVGAAEREAAKDEVTCRCAELAASRPDPGLQAQAELHLRGCPMGEVTE